MSESLETLLAAVHDPRAEVRRRAVLLVSEAFSSSAAARDAVLASLADPVWCVREAAAAGVRHFADADGSVHTLLVALTLRDSSPHVRLAAAITAGPRIQPARDYENAVRHHFERQRIRAALALGHSCPERAAEAVSLLSLCVADSHPKVRLSALHSLARIEPVAVLPVLSVVVCKCAEADDAIATAALAVWTRILTVPVTEPLRPLEPYPGTANLVGVQMTIAQLPAGHILRGVWDSLPLPAEQNLNAHRFARHLARVCEAVLAEATRTSS